MIMVDREDNDNGRWEDKRWNKIVLMWGGKIRDKRR